MIDGKHINQHGATFYYLDGELHRMDGPAYIHPDGAEIWWKHGVPMAASEILIIKEGIEWDKIVKDMCAE